MNISIIERERPWPWEVEQLVQAGRERGHGVEVVDVTDLNTVSALIASLGEVVIWRSSSLIKNFSHAHVVKPTLLSLLVDRLPLSASLVTKPYLPFKLSQHIFLEREGVRTIPTFHYARREDLQRALGHGQFVYPFVKKPNRGCGGFGVCLLKDEAAVQALPENISTFVFQPYLANDGDYRVLMLGGVLLGAIRRRACVGEWRNNISQGGQAELVTDPLVLFRLAVMGEAVARWSGLDFFGLDVLPAADDQRLYFLELNTSPDWRGFQGATNIPVATHVVRFCEQWHIQYQSHRAAAAPVLPQSYARR